MWSQPKVVWVDILDCDGWYQETLNAKFGALCSNSGRSLHVCGGNPIGPSAYPKSFWSDSFFFNWSSHFLSSSALFCDCCSSSSLWVIFSANLRSFSANVWFFSSRLRFSCSRTSFRSLNVENRCLYGSKSSVVFNKTSLKLLMVHWWQWAGSSEQGVQQSLEIDHRLGQFGSRHQRWVCSYCN